MRGFLSALAVGVVLAAFGAVTAQAITPSAGRGLPPPGTGVSHTPATDTPHFDTHTRHVEQVRQLVECGGTMYAVGTFFRILHGRDVFERHNVFSFSATRPFNLTSWAPKVKGTVNSITFRRGKCSHAYIGGSFTSVNGTPAQNIAEISTRTGAVVKRFRHRANQPVETLLATHGHILVGGFYTSINGSSGDPYMTSLNPTTGRDDGFVHLKISGFQDYPRVAPNRTHVYNQALSHSGRFDLVMGDFTSVEGRPRQQIFMVDLEGKSAKLTAWRSPEFDSHCYTGEPFYIRAASWSPNDHTIYLADTGFHPYDQSPNHHPRRDGLCDAAAAFPATHASVRHIWINYTGCYSLFSTAADTSTAYFAGHEIWSMNFRGCKFRGAGAIFAQGMEGVSPATGVLYVNSHHTGYYTRARGYGADDMLLTTAGLWIADDNYDNNGQCGGVRGLSGICFLPYH